MYYSSLYSSPVGEITLSCKDERLIGLWLETFRSSTCPPNMVRKNDCRVFSLAKRWLDRYFARQEPAADELELAPSGSAFCQCVWNFLLEIPYGTLTTYGDIARKVAEKMGVSLMSSQAVGGAVGRNPISIIIPCHRVVGAKGGLVGFAGGLQAKMKLLELEGIDVSLYTTSF